MFSTGATVPQRTFDNTRRHFWLSLLGRGVEARGAAKTSYNAQDSPHDKKSPREKCEQCQDREKPRPPQDVLGSAQPSAAPGPQWHTFPEASPPSPTELGSLPTLASLCRLRAPTDRLRPGHCGPPSPPSTAALGACVIYPLRHRCTRNAPSRMLVQVKFRRKPTNS